MPGTFDDHAQLSRLIYSYAELIDQGDFEGVGSLFDTAELKLVGQSDLGGRAEVVEMLQRHIILHDGVPRTQHLVNNILVEIDPDGVSATARSRYTVIQASSNGGISIVAAGRYHDKFKKCDRLWKFSYRDLTLLDFTGDSTEHLKNL